MSYRRAMEYLGLKSYHSLTKLINQGLPVIEVGKSKKISRNDIDDFMNSHKHTAVK